jgi:hypothetical protein
MEISHGSYSNNMESQCLVNIIDFINIKNYFNHFLIYFHFHDVQFFVQINFHIASYEAFIIIFGF